MPLDDKTGFAKEADLTDPVQLVGKCDSLAAGLQQQVDTANSGVPLPSRPFQAFYFEQIIAALRASAAMVRQKVKVDRPGKWNARGEWELPPEPTPAAATTTETKPKEPEKVKT